MRAFLNSPGNQLSAGTLRFIIGLFLGSKIAIKKVFPSNIFPPNGIARKQKIKIHLPTPDIKRLCEYYRGQLSAMKLSEYFCHIKIEVKKYLGSIGVVYEIPITQ